MGAAVRRKCRAASTRAFPVDEGTFPLAVQTVRVARTVNTSWNLVENYPVNVVWSIEILKIVDNIDDRYVRRGQACDRAGLFALRRAARRSG
ncbi:hypothetical protein D3C84_294590 [compost metagenome]